jgi:hypothetical protein
MIILLGLLCWIFLFIYSVKHPCIGPRAIRGGGGTEVVQASAPAQPSTADAVNAWVKSLPQVYETQMQYAPQEAAQQVQLAQQYALPLGQAYKTAQEAMYPGTSAIQETLAGQALQGSQATQMPTWMKDQYLSDYRANLGTNAGSGIGADYVSRGMQNQLFQQQKYYRDLGLTLAGRQPLSTPSTPATTNFASTFTPGSNMNFMQQGYGTYASASRPLGYSSGGGGLFGMLGM